MFKLKPPRLLSGIGHRIKWSEVIKITVSFIDMTFRSVLSAKRCSTMGTGPAHVTPLASKCKVRLGSIVPRLNRLRNSQILFFLTSSPKPPPQLYFLIKIIKPPPPPPQCYCFKPMPPPPPPPPPLPPPPPPPPPSQFYCLKPPPPTPTP